MAARNTIRYYTENSYYHIYNRGVEKRLIFLDSADYKTFLYYLFIYLAPPEIVQKRYPKLLSRLKKNNLSSAASLISFSLMPNHFHLLVLQKEADAITKLMRRVTVAYTHYFNEKYNNRVGGLLQGVFKAVLVDTEEYLLYLTAYIHRNALSLQEVGSPEKLQTYRWSSYPIFLGQMPTSYIARELILPYFSQTHPELSYQSFVEQTDPSEILPNSLLLD